MHEHAALFLFQFCVFLRRSESRVDGGGDDDDDIGSSGGRAKPTHVLDGAKIASKPVSYCELRRDGADITSEPEHAKGTVACWLLFTRNNIMRKA